MTDRNLTPICTAVLIMSLSLPASSALAQVQFRDVTRIAGVEYTGESYGASWGDVNGDRLPDLFVSHHRNKASLYVNLANGTFEDRESEVGEWQRTPRSDMHGGTFADYNNDGHNDLMITAGSKNFTQFLVNDGSRLTDRIGDFTFDVKSWGARLPFWFDYNNDGKLDLAVAVQGSKFQLHQRVGNDFQRRNNASRHNCQGRDYAHLADWNFDGTMDWLCVTAAGAPEHIYDYSSGTPFIDRGSLATPLSNSTDSAMADFDGDQIMDLFALRGKVRINGAEIVDPRTVEAHITLSGNNDAGVTFRSTGDLAVELHWSGPNVSQIHIGASGRHPPPADRNTPITFTLSPSDPKVRGLKPYNPATDRGIYIGYNPASNTWTYINSGGGAGQFSYTYTYLRSTAPVSNLTEFGIRAIETPRVPALMKYNGNKFINQIANTGLDEPVLCNAVAAADFDNDMDVDLYYVCRDAVSNLPNRLYFNDGTGNFVAAAGPHGAEGPSGPGVGLGENVVASDYDVDGFVDLFTTNGLKLYPEIPEYSSGGPDKLFRNLGNTNNWIQLDLTGVTSNRNGIGATVTATAGGVTQVRDQNGGYHRWAQHDQRIHFGLANNATVDITVEWPSGQVDNHLAVSANDVYEIVEGASKVKPVTIPTTPPPPPSGCVAAREPNNYDTSADRGLFLWKDNCSSSNWNLRASGGTGPFFRFTGDIRSQAAFANVEAFRFEANDVLDRPVPRRIEYEMQVGASREDGVNFRVDPAASTCIGTTSNVTTIFVGRNRVPVSVPFDLETLGPCSGSQPSLTIDDVSVAEDDSAGVAVFDVSLSTASPNNVTVNYVTANGTATTPGDYLSKSGVLTFLPGQLSKTIRVRIVDDNATEGAETFSVILSSPVNALLADTTGVGTITDAQSASCGAPSFSKATERAVFVWQKCSTGAWAVRTTGGGGPMTRFIGSFTASQPLTSVVEVGLERADVLDRSDPNAVAFELQLNGSQQDGFNVQVPGGADLCFNLTQPNVPVYVGANRQTPGLPFNPATLAACGAPGGGGSIPITSWNAPSGGVVIAGNNLSYSGAPTSWTNSATSANFSSFGISGAYRLRWTIGSNPAGTTWVAGFGVTETGTNWRDVDYGLRSSGGNLAVYEDGKWQTNVGRLAAGDELEMHVNGTLLNYRLNGVTVYTSVISGSRDFYLDSSFKQGAIDLTSFTLIDN